MCGIYGYVGKNNAYEEVIKGLYLLQYRGYDSCGVAYYNNGFKINKALGTLDNLPKTLDNIPHIAFGHTRWATNGEVNIENTHPHISYNKEFIIVHNGIIKNAEQIKEKLINMGIQFYSDTDTEVIVNLLSTLSGDIENRIAYNTDEVKKVENQDDINNEKINNTSNSNIKSGTNKDKEIEKKEINQAETKIKKKNQLLISEEQIKKYEEQHKRKNIE